MKKKAIQFRRQFDPNYVPSPGTVNNEKSMCVPDMSLSVKQLMNNIINGIPSEVTQYEPQYFGDTEIPIITDLNDYAEARRALDEQKNILEIQIKKEQDEKLAQDRADYEKRMKDQQNAPQTPSAPPDKGTETKK